MPNPWSQKDKNSEVLSSYLSESELNEYKQLSILERDPSTPSSQFSITPFFSLFGQDWFGLHFQENVGEGISLSKKITWSSLVLFPHFPTYMQVHVCKFELAFDEIGYLGPGKVEEMHSIQEPAWLLIGQFFNLDGTCPHIQYSGGMPRNVLASYNRATKMSKSVFSLLQPINMMGTHIYLDNFKVPPSPSPSTLWSPPPHPQQPSESVSDSFRFRRQLLHLPSLGACYDKHYFLY